MTARDYLKDKSFSILIFVVTEALSASLLWLISVRTLFILFFQLLFLTAFIIIMSVDFIKRQHYYNNLIRIFEQLDEKTLLSEIVKRAPFIDGEILYDILRKTDKYMNDKIANYERTNREYREYVEMWVHEIKTPITSARLIIENDKNITTLHIDDELGKIDRFVEQVLYYARSTSLEKDFKIQQITLKELVMSAVKSYSKPIIQSGGHIEFDSLHWVVYADKKWTEFIIGQLLANAAKYGQKNLLIQFSGHLYKNEVCLTISDNGIGIPSQDLPRVFDKGFTGENGRHYNKSTGIGLYLCKKLCQKMNMEISISSVVNQGTQLKIYFPKNSLIL